MAMTGAWLWACPLLNGVVGRCSRVKRPPRVAGFAELVQELRARSLTVSDVWQQVCEYGMEVNTRRHDRRVTPRLFQFLRARLIDDRGSSGVDPPGTMVLDPPP